MVPLALRLNRFLHIGLFPLLLADTLNADHVEALASLALHDRDLSGLRVPDLLTHREFRFVVFAHFDYFFVSLKSPLELPWFQEPVIDPFLMVPSMT